MVIKCENPSAELKKQIELYNNSLKKLAGAVEKHDELNTAMDSLREQLVGLNTNGKEVDARISLLKANIKSVVKIVDENNNAIKKASSTTEEGKKIIQQLESRNMSAYEHYYNYSIELEESREWLKKAQADSRTLSVIEIPKTKQEIDNQTFYIIEMVQVIKDFAQELRKTYALDIDFNSVDSKIQEKLSSPKAKIEIEPVELVSSDEDFK